METTPGFVPFISIGFTGASVQNGKVVNRSNAGYKTIGGAVDPNDSNNDGLTATFGLVLSRDPTADAGLFAIGKPSGYIASGVLMFDAGIAQNDPAKSGYTLAGLPIAVVYEGTVRYQTWTKTQSGAIDPVLGATAIYRALSTGTGSAAIGAVEFLPAGTLASALPTGWAMFPGYVVEVESTDGVALEIDFNTGEVGLPALGTPFFEVATLTSAAAATAVHVVPVASVPTGKKVYITNLLLNVNGATAWTDSTATIVKLQDTAGSPVVAITAAKAQLTANAHLGMLTAGITLGTPVLTGVGLTASQGLDIVADANFAAGSNIIVTVVGFIQ